MSEMWELGLHPAQAETHEPIQEEDMIDRDNPFEDIPEPSDYDVENLRNILSGDGDWFDAYLFRLILKADGHNTERLRMVYPLHVKAFEVHTGRAS